MQPVGQKLNIGNTVGRTKRAAAGRTYLSGSGTETIQSTRVSSTVGNTTGKDVKLWLSFPCWPWLLPAFSAWWQFSKWWKRLFSEFWILNLCCSNWLLPFERKLNGAVTKKGSWIAEGAVVIGRTVSYASSQITVEQTTKERQAAIRQFNPQLLPRGLHLLRSYRTGPWEEELFLSWGTLGWIPPETFSHRHPGRCTKPLQTLSSHTQTHARTHAITHLAGLKEQLLVFLRISAQGNRSGSYSHRTKINGNCVQVWLTLTLTEKCEFSAHSLDLVWFSANGSLMWSTE